MSEQDQSGNPQSKLSFPPDYTAPLWIGKIEDITTFKPRGTTELEKAFFEKDYSHHGQIEVKTNDYFKRTGRGMVAGCFAGECLSITLRGGQEEKREDGRDVYSPVGEEAPEPEAAKTGPEQQAGDPAPVPQPGEPMDMYAPDNKTGNGFLLSRKNICKLLDEQIFPKGDPAVGLVLVAGATSSSKSIIARGLVKLYLDRRLRAVHASTPKPEGDSEVARKSYAEKLFKNTERRPHLLTVEEPIEVYRYEIEKAPPRWEPPDKTQKRVGLDYTPREIGKDVASLEQALMFDAVRQTPTVVYVGELRGESDIQIALDFATTGHLIISTIHAGSLVETMDRLFHAREVKTPQDRGNVASLVRGIVHLRLLPVIESSGQTKKVLAPAIWRGTAQGVASVVADGLSALVPNRPNLGDNSSESSHACIGRTALIESLLDEDTDAKLKAKVVTRTLQEDLQGV